MHRSIPRFYFYALITLFAWQFCHADDALTSAQLKWDEAEKVTNAAFTKYQDIQKKVWEETRQRVLQKWSDGKLPQEKTYIEYFDSETTRVQVDYENGNVTVEALVAPKESSNTLLSAKSKINKALSAIISSDSTVTTAVLNTDEISMTKESVSDLAESLSQKTEPRGLENGGDGQLRGLYRVTFKMVPDYVKRRAAMFKPTVDLWAKKYNLDPAFILAIMRQESAFNPRARSWVGAIGLMQIVPVYAGKEVFKIVKNQDVVPTDNFLYDPKNNIMIGVTYLQILRDQYFADIKDEPKQRYLITCSYNWGAGRIRKAIVNGRLPIRGPASEVFDRLNRITPDETKGYLKRVSQFTKEFRGE